LKREVAFSCSFSLLISEKMKKINKIKDKTIKRIDSTSYISKRSFPLPSSFVFNSNSKGQHLTATVGFLGLGRYKTGLE
jgi:hypothetical protein